MKRDGKTVAVRLDREAVIVGSGPACNIKVPEGGLAQRHAQILRMNNGFILRDLSGDVGTFVNGKKVKEHLLSDRDVIQMGQERFTYAEQEGEATARVAVSAAPPPTTRMPAAQPPTQRAQVAAPPAAAPKGQTARVVAVDPNRKTTTRAMPPVAEAPAPSGKSTARMQKTGGTQRLAASTTRKMSSRTTGRITKSTETFSMPKTRKGKIIAACVALGLLGLGGVMVVVLMGQDKPDEIKADLKARIVQLNKITDPIKKLAEAEDIHNNDKFKKYGAKDYSDIGKALPRFRQDAIDQKAADAEVTPFFQKYNTAKADPEKMKSDADGLYDEAKSLADKYASSNYAEKLRVIRDELKTALEARKSAGDYTIPLVTLKREVEAMLKEGKCKEAAGKVDEFGVKFNEKEVAELFNQLKDVRERIKRGAEEFVKKKNNEAQNLVKDGKKADALKLLEGCRAGLEGYTAALEKLEAAIKAVKG
jgi:hypothetical protein